MYFSFNNTFSLSIYLPHNIQVIHSHKTKHLKPLKQMTRRNISCFAYPIYFGKPFGPVQFTMMSEHEQKLSNRSGIDSDVNDGDKVTSYTALGLQSMQNCDKPGLGFIKADDGHSQQGVSQQRLSVKRIYGQEKSAKHRFPIE